VVIHHHIREKIEWKDILVKKFGTNAQMADVLTKALHVDTFKQFLARIDMDPPAPTGPGPAAKRMARESGDVRSKEATEV